jgi:DNA-binding IclR family transcriptional regulator
VKSNTLSRLPKATALRIARQLVARKALERTDSGHYSIGLGLLEIASLAPRGHGLHSVALPYMSDLWHATQQHVQLVVREDLECVLVERLSAPNAARIMYQVGGRMPLHRTAPGLVLLAYAPAEVQQAFLACDWPANEEGMNNGDALRARLAAIRRQRYAVFSLHQWGIPMTGVAHPSWTGAAISTPPSPPSRSSSHPSRSRWRRTPPRWSPWPAPFPAPSPSQGHRSHRRPVTPVADARFVDPTMRGSQGGVEPPTFRLSARPSSAGLVRVPVCPAASVRVTSTGGIYCCVESYIRCSGRVR